MIIIVFYRFLLYVCFFLLILLNYNLAYPVTMTAIDSGDIDLELPEIVQIFAEILPSLHFELPYFVQFLAGHTSQVAIAHNVSEQVTLKFQTHKK